MKHFFSVLFLVFFSFTAQAQGKSLPDFTELVDKHGAAVVNISTTQVLKSAGRNAMPFPFDEDDPISDLFRRFIPRTPGNREFLGNSKAVRWVQVLSLATMAIF